MAAAIEQFPASPVPSVHRIRLTINGERHTLEVESWVSLLDLLQGFYAQMGSINPYATTVGVVTLVAGLLVRRLWPRVPG